MIFFDEVSIIKKKVRAIQCDRCKKTFKVEEDILEIQEFHRINFTGGYASVFGDEERIECDLCQNCLKELIGGFYRTVE